MVNISHTIRELLISIAAWTPPTILGLAWMDMTAWFNTYVFDDWLALNWFLVLLLVDTASGVVMHMIRKPPTFDPREMLLKTGVNKMLIPGLFMVVVHSLGVVVEMDPGAVSEDILKFFSAGSLVIYMTGSIADNFSEITGGKFPPGWSALRKLRS